MIMHVTWNRGGPKYQRISIIFFGFSGTKLSYRTGLSCGHYSPVAHIRLTSAPPSAELQYNALIHFGFLEVLPLRILQEKIRGLF